ncbi:TonB-dependent receptor [Novosphingobium sp.]|uniref:TonB-dependent receptor n=1 Tax=Novosphingobium sp. TaxID=1874826 RepID=UPI0026368239|nr:TonB-dependent receptor [Novosphingobium sp.]
MGMVGQILRLVIAASTSVVALAASQVQAQEADAEPSAGLEAIVVTARKRVENLQDVSSSISALGATDLAKRFDSDVRDFANASPNVLIDDTQQGPGGVAAIYIRGIGVADVEKSVDPAVGVVIDDIYLGQSSGSLLKAIDVDRVEVLRGPQGTLFGRNATGGVINLARSRPTQELTGKVRGTYSSFETYDLQGVVSFGITPDVALKVSGAYNSTDGYIFNRTQNQPGQKSDFRAIGAQLLITPTEALEVSLSYDHQLTRQDPGQLHAITKSTDLFCAGFGYCSPSPGVPISGDRYITVGNAPVDKSARFELDMAIGKIKYDLGGDFELQYIFGYLKTNESINQDFDSTPETLYHTDRPARWRQITNEARLIMGGTGPLTFVLGGFHWDSKYTINLKNYIGFAGAPLLTSAQDVTQTTKSYAAYFEGDYRITDKLKLTLGGRYTHDRKTSIVNDKTIFIYGTLEEANPVLAIPPTLAGGAIVMGTPAKQSWSEFTPKVSLSYDWTDDVMTYALWSRGYRAGGFNGRPATLSAATTPYNPETLDNFELGFKSQFLDDRLRLNAAVYLMKYKDMQQDLDVPAPGTSTGRENRTINASQAELKGFEVDLTAQITPEFTIAGNVGYLDAKYKNFVGDIFSTGTPVDATFLRIRRAPKWTWDLRASYEREVGPGLLMLNAELHHIGAHELTFLNNPNLRNGAQNMLDTSISYRINNTMISVFAKNLLDENGWTIGYDVQNVWSYAAPRPPRAFGVAVTQTF